MPGIDYPSLLPSVFASGGDYQDIPDSDADEGRMAWDVGFPTETSQPIAIGGVPPRRLDMNGFGNRLSQHLFWQQSGGLYNWNASLDYPVGAHIRAGNGLEYIAQAQSGPSYSSGAVDPTTDINGVYWKTFAQLMVDIIYPVGSIYMSVGTVSPATLFGGTWVPIQGRFLLASSSTYPLGTTSGAATHQLAFNEMPVHTHDVTVQNSDGHTHAATAAKNGTHSHTITVNNGGSHSHSISIANGAQSAGGHSHTISVTGGATSAGAHTHNVKLTAQEVSGNTAYVDAHSHSVTYTATTVSKTGSAGDHTHTRGNMNITGTISIAATSLNGSTATDAFSVSEYLNHQGGAPDAGNKSVKVTFDAKNGWTGSLQTNGAHTHSFTVPAKTMTTTDNNRHRHAFTITVPAQTYSNAALSAGAHTHNLSGTTASVGGHTHNVSGTTATDGTHNHTATAADAGLHDHTITVKTGGVHTHAVTVGTAGGNAAFSVMPPYLAVNVWQRTA